MHNHFRPFLKFGRIKTENVLIKLVSLVTQYFLLNFFFSFIAFLEKQNVDHTEYPFLWPPFSPHLHSAHSSMLLNIPLKMQSASSRLWLSEACISVHRSVVSSSVLCLTQCWLTVNIQ